MKKTLSIVLLGALVALFFSCTLGPDLSSKASLELNVNAFESKNSQSTTDSITNYAISLLNKTTGDYKELLSQIDIINVAGLDKGLWEVVVKALNKEQKSVLEGIQQINIKDGNSYKLDVPIAKENKKGDFEIIIYNHNHMNTEKITVTLKPSYGNEIKVCDKSTKDKQVKVEKKGIPVGRYNMIAKQYDANNQVQNEVKEEVWIHENQKTSRTVNFQKKDQPKSTPQPKQNVQTAKQDKVNRNVKISIINDAISVKILGLRNEIRQNETLNLSIPNNTGIKNAVCEWYLNGKKVSTKKNYQVKGLKPGHHNVQVKVKSKDGSISSTAYSSFIVKS